MLLKKFSEVLDLLNKFHAAHLALGYAHNKGHATPAHKLLLAGLL